MSLEYYHILPCKSRHPHIHKSIPQFCSQKIAIFGVSVYKPCELIFFTKLNNSFTVFIKLDQAQTQYKYNIALVNAKLLKWTG